MHGWLGARLHRKLMIAAVSGLIVVSAVFLVLFVAMYRTQLEHERARASVQVNHLLEAALENAMLKRDLDGLRQIVDRLGAQDDIRGVMILNPEGEVRFASDPSMRTHQFAQFTDATCATCHTDDAPADRSTAFMADERGNAVLRSVNAVHNREPCTGCHGPVATNPINGILLVDYDAQPILDQARAGAFLLSGSGAVVILLMVLGAGWWLRRFVLGPIGRLSTASGALAADRLDARVAVDGTDELAALGRTFNHMAATIQGSLQEIREQEAFLQGVIDAIPDGVRVIADDFSIVKVNQAYCDQLGTDAATAMASPCYRSSHGRKERCPATLVRCPLVEIARHGRSLQTFQQHVRADGSELLVEVVAAPMVLGTGSRRRTLVIEAIRDLSRVVQYSHEQRLAELGHLAAGVAHEVHNPLATIRLSVHAMLRDARSGRFDPDELCAYLAAADAEIETCIEVTERLLKLSAPATGSPDVVWLNRAIEDTISLLRHEADRQGIRVCTYLHPSDPRVIAAESDIRMVLFNLVQNAFHAMPAGGRLSVASMERCGEVSLSVTDTGVGIAEADVARVFDPFFSHRADGAQGTGLGLSICKAIIDRYGGRIELTTRVGEGTCFTINLPRADAAVAPVRESVA